MSLESHPNFHAAAFTSDVMHSFYASLRGSANRDRIHHERSRDLVLKFIADMEELVDISASEVPEPIDIMSASSPMDMPNN